MASSARTEKGLPPRITAPYIDKSEGILLYGNISQKMLSSRTRRAINCVYCEPKSRISTLCCIGKNRILRGIKKAIFEIF